jgi:hypothetical protein
MKATLLSLFLALLMVGCGGPDLDDKETRDKIIAEAIDKGKLQKRGKDAEEPLLIPCKACKHEVSWKGEACANCSHPIADSVRAYKDGLSDEELYYAPNEQTPYTGWEKENTRHGQIYQLTQYKNGKRDGPTVIYNEDGTEKYRIIYKDGEIAK